MQIKGKETVELQQDFPFKIYKTYGNKDNNVLPHYHNCLEVNYVISGKGINIIEDVVYEIKPGDIYIINNYEHHMAYAHGGYEMIIIYFEPELIWGQNSFNYQYLKPFFSRKKEFSNQIKGDAKYADIFASIIIKMFDEWNKKEISHLLMVKAQLMEFLALLCRHYSSVTNREENSQHSLYGQVHDVIQYIHQNLHNKITLEELAEIACMNKTYLSTYFKKATGNNLSSYIETVRINKAAQLIKTTDKSITEICFEVGFNNPTHFSRIFKKQTNMSAREYRNLEISNTN